MKTDLVMQSNIEEFIEIEGKSGNKFTLRKNTYGVLVPDVNNPLSCVSVSNDSLSIDLWTGCPWQCRYCHVQGTYNDLRNEGRMLKIPQRRSSFSVKEIIDDLVEHPFFTPNETIISIGTASTEPFSEGPVVESTFEIMFEFIERGLKNPFWIITKGGIPKHKKQSMAKIVQAGNPLMISICWANNPNTIEPVNNNRFRGVEEAKEAGATISWHLRPIVNEWSGSERNIEMMMLWVNKNYHNMIDSIVPGGLRWTEGIEYGLTELSGIEMPKIPKKDNVKYFSPSLWKKISKLSKELFPGVPLYQKSSCCMSKMLGTPSINLVQHLCKGECEESICPIEQRQICASYNPKKIGNEGLQNIFDKLNLNIKAIGITENYQIMSEPSMINFTYAINQTVKKELAKGGYHERKSSG